MFFFIQNFFIILETHSLILSFGTNPIFSISTYRQPFSIILTCSFVGGIANGVNFLTFDYPLTNVLYTNRTNEGLIFSENLKNSDNFGNLRYSIKRNMKHWFAVLSTYGKFIPLKNSLFFNILRISPSFFFSLLTFVWIS